MYQQLENISQSKSKLELINSVAFDLYLTNTKGEGHQARNLTVGVDTNVINAFFQNLRCLVISGVFVSFY